jgi:hypothetical protein
MFNSFWMIGFYNPGIVFDDPVDSTWPCGENRNPSSGGLVDHAGLFFLKGGLPQVWRVLRCVSDKVRWNELHIACQLPQDATIQDDHNS